VLLEEPMKRFIEGEGYQTYDEVLANLPDIERAA
jgi:hypothetical protein